MSTERARQEWEYFERQVLPAYIDRLNNLEEQKTDLDLKKKEIIREIAEKVEDAGWVPHEQISSYLKKVLKGIVKTDTIEDALGKKHKRKWASPIIGKPESPVSERERSQSVLPKKEIEVSSGGSESYSSPEEPEPKEPQEDTDQIRTKPLSSTNQASEKEELETRLSEALKLADDKDRALERERIKFANLEVELGNKANPPSNKVDANEELQIKYDELKQAYDELLEVERLRTSHSDFKSAAALPKQAWIAAINVFGLSRALTKISMNLDSDSSAARLKVLFDVTSEGQIKNPRLEGDVT